MKEYEIVLTYLNGCAGAAYPLRSIEEVQIHSPEEYLRLDSVEPVYDFSLLLLRDLVDRKAN